mgnify:FL=1|jgi:hypothetical protein
MGDVSGVVSVFQSQIITSESPVEFVEDSHDFMVLID